MVNEEKQQELIYKLNVFEQQANQIQQQLQAIEQGILELNSLNNGLDELEGKKDKEILAPFGRGIFVKAKLLSEDLIVDVGGKNFVEKDIPGTKKIIEEQLEKIEEVKVELNQTLENMQQEVSKLIEKAQAEENHEHSHNHRHKH